MRPHTAAHTNAIWTTAPRLISVLASPVFRVKTPQVQPFRENKYDNRTLFSTSESRFAAAPTPEFPGPPTQMATGIPTGRTTSSRSRTMKTFALQTAWHSLQIARIQMACHGWRAEGSLISTSVAAMLHTLKDFVVMDPVFYINKRLFDLKEWY